MNSSSRLIKRFTGLAALLALLFGCGGGGGNNDDDEPLRDTGQDARVAQMRFVNMIPDSPQIEMFHSGRNSSAFTEFLDFGNGSARKDFVIGLFQFNFNYVNGQGQRITLYEEADFPLGDGEEFTYIMIGELANAQLLRVDNTEFLVGLDDATADVEPQIQFVHAALGVGPIDFYVTENGAALSAEPRATVTYGEHSTISEIAASDSTQLRAYPAGNTTDLLFDTGATAVARTTRSMIVAANYFGPSNGTQDSVQLLRFDALPVALGNANQPSSIRVHNAVADENAIDLYLDSVSGTPLIENVGFTARSPEVVVPAGSNTLIVTASGNPSNTLLTAENSDLFGGERRTLYIGGEGSNPDDNNNPNIGASLETESTRAIAAGVPVRVFNGATQNEDLSVFLLRPGESIAGSQALQLAMGGYSSVSVVSGEFDLVIVETASFATIYGPERVIPEQGTTLNIVIRDTFGGTTPVVVDFTSEATVGL